ncbi:BZ3500_MvSof-1268-A1-R1_Chr1-3g02264 [Microbotryum saponariae]|uniref:BZ3500_MvSof-1268-A1-R1_Chr1-3g02264 protein n=1 Tax=Microbotryum saponariae TaxID=289078 RepID=A0A2X0KPL4_9BASI|nr:BZ3500_MvSof-1268-A1-R1_Chr1-3g02264 [Microbotryum saponariae]SCZ95819.1 BZ3501_MvSof-1269-A2-R1_Chr1-3g01867 [Microbotryum saponariae]
MAAFESKVIMGSDTRYNDANTILFVTLGCTIASLLCSIYSTLRTLLPLLGPHPLERRTTGSSVGPYDAPPSVQEEKRASILHPRLKSAQRFTTYLAGLDIIAVSVLVWETAVASSAGSAIGSSRAGAARLTLACAARPTLLMVVAVLSYANVVLGWLLSLEFRRSISLGRVDWVVWLPALFLVGLGTGLASAISRAAPKVWIGLVAWIGLFALIVTICFGRILVAILRVRKESERERKRDTSHWALEQERVIRSSNGTRDSRHSRHSYFNRPLGSPYLPPIHTNFSGLSTSFIGTVGRSNSTIDFSIYPATIEPSFRDANTPAVGYAPSRPSLDQDLNVRDFRSPTPGSSRGLLSSMFDTLSRAATPNTFYTSSPPPSSKTVCEPDPRPSPGGGEEEGPHEILTFEELPRPSMSSIFPSTCGEGFVGGPAIRNAIVKEVWAGAPIPGSGHGPTVELSRKEARGALVRIGGHLAGCLVGFAFIAPFLFARILRPDALPPLLSSMLLVVGISQPGIILAAQCALSEGFWFKHPIPPVLTSSSAADLERSHARDDDNPSMRERASSFASSCRYATSASTLPGIPTDGEDVETPKGTLGKSSRSSAPPDGSLELITSSTGRAMAMASAHPKLLVLSEAPTSKSAAVTSGANHNTHRSGAHVRLRSLQLAKSAFSTITSRYGHERGASVASRATVGGFEHPSEQAPVSSSPEVGYREDELITRSLLLARRASIAVDRPRHRLMATGTSRHTHSFFGNLASVSQVVSTSAFEGKTPEYSFHTRELTLSSQISANSQGADSPNYTIDYLSSQVLPRLRPDIKVGSSTTVKSESMSHHRRPSVPLGCQAQSMKMREFGHGGSGSARRNFSLPNVFHRDGEDRSSSPEEEDPWVAIEEDDARAASSPLKSITRMVRGEGMSSSHRSKPSIKNRSDDAWDQVEASEKSTSRRRRPSSIQIDSNSRRVTCPEPHIVISPPPAAAVANEVGDSEAEILTEEHDFADSEGEDDEHIQEAVFRSYQAAQSKTRLEHASPTSTQSDEPSTTVHNEFGQPQQVPVRPSSQSSNRDSTGSNISASLLRRLDFSNESFASTRSIISTSDSITSIGFRNLLETNSWHAREELSSSEERSSSEVSRVHRSINGFNTARSSSGVLGGRDINAARLSSASESEDSDSRPRKAVVRRSSVTTSTAASQAPHRRISSIPIPPIPDTITEDFDEDKKSNAGSTPRAGRTRVESTTTTIRGRGTPGRQTPEPVHTVHPAVVTSPGITTRSRVRTAAMTRHDENAAPGSVLKTQQGPHEIRGSRTPVRTMR